MRNKLLSGWSAVLGLVGAALMMSVHALGVSETVEAAGHESVRYEFVHDKPGEQAQKIELFERLHRGW